MARVSAVIAATSACSSKCDFATPSELGGILAATRKENQSQPNTGIPD
jgi:hypothetical protein